MSTDIEIDLLPRPQIVEVSLERSKPVIAVSVRGQGEVSAEMTATVLASGIEQSIYVDASRPIAYVGYSSRIVRMDYATWPPVETTATTANVHTDWPNRASLTYT